MKVFFSVLFFLAWCLSSAIASEVAVTSADGYEQPVIFYQGDPGKPLIVSLHSWHGSYKFYDSFEPTLRFAKEHGWSFISPDFRGPANSPKYQLMHAGSDYAIDDVLTATAWAVDASSAGNVYIMGGSGGGYMALLVASRHPNRFRAVASYAGITELAAWWEWCFRRPENLNIYSDSVASSLGGTPSEVPDAYAFRSPMRWLAGLATIPVHIQHGIRDQTVPLDHAINAFNEVVEAKGMDAAQIVGAENADLINKGRYGATLPAEISAQAGAQGSYDYALPFVRKIGDIQIVIEQAGHTGDPQVIFDFLQKVDAGTF